MFVCMTLHREGLQVTLIILYSHVYVCMYMTLYSIYTCTYDGGCGAESSKIVEHDILCSGIEGRLPKQTVVQSSYTYTHREREEEEEE